MLSRRRAHAQALALALAALAAVQALPAATAHHDPVHSGQEVQAEATAYAQDSAGAALGVLPDCAVLSGPWLASCQDGATVVGCGTDPATLYRCRLLFEGSGGDVDGGPAGSLAGAVLAVAGAGAGRAAATAGALAGAGLGVASVAVAEAVSWQGWATGHALALRDLALAAKQPYQDAGVRFVAGVQTESDEVLRRALTDAQEALLQSLHGAAAPDYRFTAAVDSGPVTIFVTDKRPADDPCHPGQGLRVLGSDCKGPLFVNLEGRAELGCNAYTSIALAQPCGGHVARDWDWTADGTGLYPRPLQAARLSFGSDGRATVHDALGVLHCNAPAHENGYWLQSAYVSVAESTFGEHPIGQQDSRAVAVFGDDAGTCTVSYEWWSGRYLVSYDVTFNGVAMRAAGTFLPEGPVEDLARCGAGADTRSPETASCEGVLHTGGGA